MWILFVFLLTVSHGLGMSSEDCGDKLKSCRPSNPLGDFPETEEDLRSMCKTGVEVFSCLSDVPKECSKLTKIVNVADKLLAGTNALCDEDSNIFGTLVENLVCLKNTIFTSVASCRDFAFERSASVREKGFLKEDAVKYKCMQETVEFACILKNIKEDCGREAERAVLEVLSSLWNLAVEYCPKEIIPDMEEMLELVELEEEVKDRVNLQLASIRDS